MEITEKDAYCRWIEHKGTRLLEFDLRGCSGEEATRRQVLASRLIATCPQDSVRCLTLAWGVRYDPRHMREFVRCLRANDPYVIASAIVGLQHLTRLINVLNRLSGRRVRAFDDTASAMEWLVDAESERTGSLPALDPFDDTGPH